MVRNNWMYPNFSKWNHMFMTSLDGPNPQKTQTGQNQVPPTLFAKMNWFSYFYVTWLKSFYIS